MPPNLQTVSLKFARRRSAKVMGSLALKESEPVEGEEVQGVLVTHNFTSKIVKPDDLAAYTPLRVGSISSKLHVPFTGSIETLRLFLSEMFSGLTETQIVEDDIDGQKTCHKFSCYQDKVRKLKIVLYIYLAIYLPWLKKKNKKYSHFFSCLLFNVQYLSCTGECSYRKNRKSGHCRMGSKPSWRCRC
mmetsp:Transcript_14547/g.14409  ORF Transcript_14547/g.14409 Transcript_14547/m.14409 type:complete len:188 (+) Transcript_14547:110-673(+)